MTPVVVTIPLRLTNPMNGSHQHWAVKAKVRKAVRYTVALALRGPLLPAARILEDSDMAIFKNARAGHPGGTVVEELRVKVTRIAPRALDRHDGLPASCKPVVDAIAECLGVDDADPRVSWSYGQERGKPREYAVRVTVEVAP